MTPALGMIVRHAGIAGQYSYTVPVTYEGEETRTVEFVGNVYGGPIVMVTDADQVLVTEPERFGRFSPEWVRRFFAGS
jgi:hypothetical protein